MLSYIFSLLFFDQVVEFYFWMMAITRCYLFRNTEPIEVLNFHQDANQLSLLQFKCINQIFVLGLIWTYWMPIPFYIEFLFLSKCLFLSINASNNAFYINKFLWNTNKFCRDLEITSLKLYLKTTCNRQKRKSVSYFKLC